MTVKRNLKSPLALISTHGVHWLLPGVMLVFLATGCSSLATYIVDVEVDVQVSGRDSEGRTWRAAPGEIAKQTRHPQSTSPFANIVYEGKLFEWRFLAEPKSLGYLIRSKVSGPLCFRFDQARLTSNMQPKEIPMRVSVVRHTPPSKSFVPARNLPGEKPMFIPPALCFAQEELTGIGFVVDMAELFPSGNMFDIKWEGKDTRLLNRGIGNWLKIRLPIEHEGRREEVEITLTATDSAGRLAYI